MSRPRAALLAFAVAATAGGARAPAWGAQQPRAKAILPGFRTPVWMDTTGMVQVIPGRVPAVMAALDRVLAARRVPVEVRDVDRGLLGNGRVKTQRRFAGERLSAWFDCGAGLRGLNADAYQVSIALLGMVRPAGSDSVELRMALAAGAQDFAGPLADPVSCSSTGRLEAALLREVREVLGLS